MIRLSKHGERRLDDRVVKGAGEKTAARALALGIEIQDTRGDLRRYLDGCIIRHPGHMPRIYGGHIYFFAGSCLVTVFPLPQRFVKVVAKLRARREANDR